MLISCVEFGLSLSVYSAGVIVKSIVKGSTVDQDGRVHIGDIILSVRRSNKNSEWPFVALSEDKYLVVLNTFSAES